MALAAELASAAVVARRERVREALATFCERYLGELPAPVAAAVHYATLGEGKRLRAMLLLEAHEACGGAGDAAPLAAAVEMVHAYSLVHDDLPCMDDDAMRRGRPTVHVVHGVSVATVAGLAMVPLAARAADEAAAALGLGDGPRGEVVRLLMQASGAGGMIGGQLLDLEGEQRQLGLEELERIHRAKTGALISASAALGAIAAGAAPPLRAAFERYGSAIGLAFQIADDVLDVTATTAELGKTAGKDVAHQKSTYPALLGVAGATARAEALVSEACEALRGAGVLTPSLQQLARFIVARRS